MTHDVALTDLLARAADHLSFEPPGEGDPTANPRGDHDLDGADDAVGPSVLFTVRAAHLRDHSGQIAFPGGKIDADDPTPADAALREAREEVGLTADAIRVLGYLDPYLSATGFLVVPVLGLVDPEARLNLNPDEVAATFEVPLAHLLDRTQRRIESAEWRGRRRRYYVTLYGPYRIWGVTAGILNNLQERLYP
jgi:8-oxo-dGTP pyrophosphatase MutT (NUDIX family)